MIKYVNIICCIINDYCSTQVNLKQESIQSRTSNPSNLKELPFRFSLQFVCLFSPLSRNFKYLLLSNSKSHKKINFLWLKEVDPDPYFDLALYAPIAVNYVLEVWWIKKVSFCICNSLDLDIIYYTMKQSVPFKKVKLVFSKSLFVC